MWLPQWQHAKQEVVGRLGGRGEAVRCGIVIYLDECVVVKSVVITMCCVCDTAGFFCTCVVQLCTQVYIQVIPVSDCFLTNFHFHVGNRDAVCLHEPFHQKLMLIH